MDQVRELEILLREKALIEMGGYIDIVFDGPPSMPAPRFVEVENDEGESIKVGEWIERPDGLWVLRIPLDGNNECKCSDAIIALGHLDSCPLSTFVGDETQQLTERLSD
jgi:hypothetical protein